MSYMYVFAKSKMSYVVRKLAYCICENKDADQLHGNREADQHLCFRYIDCTIPLLPKYKISSCVVVQPCLCGTWSEIPKTGFITTRLKFKTSDQPLQLKGRLVLSYLGCKL